MHGLLLFTALLTLALLVYGLYQLNQRVMRLEAKKRQIASEKAVKERALAPLGSLGPVDGRLAQMAELWQARPH